MSFRLYGPDAFAVDFEQVIISVISFSALFANGIKICSTSAAHPIGVILFEQSQRIGCWLLTGHCSDYLFPAVFANRILICFMSVAHVSPSRLLCIYGMLADYE